MKGAYQSKLTEMVGKYEVPAVTGGQGYIGGQLVNVELGMLDEAPGNDRCFNMDGIPELSENIKRNGFRGAIIVWGKPNGRYEIRSGHRRVRAAKIAGLKSVPCIIEPSSDNAPATERERFDLMVDLNINNREISPVDWMHIITEYMSILETEDNAARENGDHSPKGSRKDRCAKRFGISPAQVMRYQNMSRLIPELQKMLTMPGFPVFSLDRASGFSADDQLKLYELLSRYESPSKKDVEHMINVIAARETAKPLSGVPVVKKGDAFAMHISRLNGYINKETSREKLEGYRSILEETLKELERKIAESN